MIVRQGETQPMTVKSGTIAGIQIYAYQVAAAVNVALVPADLIVQNVTCFTSFKYKGGEYTLHNANLGLLGLFNARKNAFERYWTGYDKVLQAVATKNINVRVLNIMFANPVRCDGNELNIQFTVNAGTFGANIDATNSFFDFMPIPTIGYMSGIPMTRFESIQVNAPESQNVNTDRVRKIEFMNFDQNTLDSEVITSVSMSSDKLNYTATFNQLLASECFKYPVNKAYRFATTLPAANPSITPAMGLDYFPQCFSLFENGGRQVNLNNCRVNLQYNQANVNAGMNYVGFESVYVTPDMVRAAANRIAKHGQENIGRLIANG